MAGRARDAAIRVNGPYVFGIARSEVAYARWMLERAVTSFAITARGWDRIRRAATTIADLDAADRVGEHHAAEALAFRGST